MASQSNCNSNVSSTVCSHEQYRTPASLCDVETTGVQWVPLTKACIEVINSHEDVCMYGVSLCMVCNGCEFGDDLIHHFRIIGPTQCMNSLFAMKHIPLLSLAMP